MPPISSVPCGISREMQPLLYKSRIRSRSEVRSHVLFLGSVGSILRQASQIACHQPIPFGGSTKGLIWSLIYLEWRRGPVREAGQRFAEA